MTTLGTKEGTLWWWNRKSILLNIGVHTLSYESLPSRTVMMKVWVDLHNENTAHDISQQQKVREICSVHTCASAVWSTASFIIL